jgi:ubiquinone/menaquinone biosynthesis C-methylase UbiE
VGWNQLWINKNNGNPSLFKGIAKNLSDNIIINFPLRNDMNVLDFGCGPGYLSMFIHNKVDKLYIHDASPTMARKSRENTSGMKNVIYVERIDDYSFPPLDYIFINSVIQYVSYTELIEILFSLKKLLKKDGKIVISDILTEPCKLISETIISIYYSITHGYGLGQFKHLFSFFFSNYLQLNKKQPLNYYTQKQINQIAQQLHFRVMFLEKNLIYNRRCTVYFEEING